MSTQSPPAAEPARPVNAVRLINLGLLVAAVLLTAFVIVPQWRSVRFRFTGQAVVDGSTFYLQPGDNYLTPMVVRFGEYEPAETQLVRQILKEGDTFLDVGANVGWFTVHGSKLVGTTGRVVAFEPEPSNLGFLRKNVQANGLKNVTVEEVALSNAAGSFKLYLEKANLGMHSLVLEHGGKHFIEVPTVRLDDHWKGKGEIKLVKIDTEGAEGMILDGMRETLKAQKGMELVVEFAPERLVKSGYDPDKVLQDLYALGYKASLIDEPGRKVVFLGTPTVKELNLSEEGPATSLHFKK
ncbi:MAG: FkbM family methyltransferase [Gemmataceae bacterium]